MDFAIYFLKKSCWKFRISFTTAFHVDRYSSRWSLQLNPTDWPTFLVRYRLANSTLIVGSVVARNIELETACQCFSTAICDVNATFTIQSLQMTYISSQKAQIEVNALIMSFMIFLHYVNGQLCKRDRNVLESWHDIKCFVTNWEEGDRIISTCQKYF